MGTDSSSPASIRPGRPSRSTSTVSTNAKASRMRVLVQPVHHCRSSGLAGPYACSQARAIRVVALAGSTRSASDAAHRSTATHRNWVDVQPPLGRARTT